MLAPWSSCRRSSRALVTPLIALAACAGGGAGGPAPSAAAPPTAPAGSATPAPAASATPTPDPAAPTARATAPDPTAPPAPADQPLDPDAVCDADHPDDCGALAVRFEHGLDGFPRDVLRAGRYYRVACEARDADACAVLADLVERANPTPAGHATAMGIRRVACQLGRCMALAFALVDGETRAEHDEGRRLFAEVCDRAIEPDAATACFMRGDRATRGDGLGWYDKACRAGHARGCERQARVYAYETPLGMSPAAATRALEELCTRRVAVACVHAALRHHEGLGVPADRDESDRWLARACALGDADMCATLARRGRRTP